MKNSNFLIIRGGDSSERDVSFRTAECVEESFRRMGLKYQVLTVGSVLDLMDLSLDDVDYIFNAMHGGDGENGVVQGLLDLLGVPYNGASREASSICMSKILTRFVASANSIVVPEGVVRGAGGIDYNEIRNRLGGRVVVKPDCQGCSIGVSVVVDDVGFERAVLNAEVFNGRLLFEEFVCGFEITVAVLAGEILPFLSITHSKDFFDFNAKFNSSDTRYEVADCIPESVVDLIKASICRLCEILNFGRYARFDFIVREGIPYLLEVNTLPGLNAQSVFVKACLLSGVGYDEMICRIIGSSKV
ncbi:hypothetical protein ACJ6YJ_06535 [Pseudomonas marginalis]|uniref:D-alanine--D-alanine ligase family protein n=1 Tax=Pseudomonas TaxID=286 RepID=UPI00389980C6